MFVCQNISMKSNQVKVTFIIFVNISLFGILEPWKYIEQLLNAFEKCRIHCKNQLFRVPK